MSVALRPGSAADLEPYRRLLGECVRRGEVDIVPGGWWAERMMLGFDWNRCSRFIDGPGGPLAGVLVIERQVPGGPLVRIEVAAGPEHRSRLLDWGIAAGRLQGARIAQAWRARDAGGWLAGAGMRVARPFWRMDRPNLEAVAAPGIPPGYAIADDRSGLPAGLWADTVNRSFADHWRHSSMAPEEFERRRLRPGAIAGLDLLLLDPAGAPAAVVMSGLEDPTGDARAQPVGIVSIVGTVPAHRRRGLAQALLAEALHRLRAAGAASSSLYVDGLNPTRAYDVYRRLGYVVGYEFEVWEMELAPTA